MKRKPRPTVLFRGNRTEDRIIKSTNPHFQFSCHVDYKILQVKVGKSAWRIYHIITFLFMWKIRQSYLTFDVILWAKVLWCLSHIEAWIFKRWGRKSKNPTHTFHFMLEFMRFTFSFSNVTKRNNKKRLTYELNRSIGKIFYRDHLAKIWSGFHLVK